MYASWFPQSETGSTRPWRPWECPSIFTCRIRRCRYRIYSRSSTNSKAENRRSEIIPPMLGNCSNEQWIAQYSSSHQNPVNRICHSFGIPMIALSLVLFVVTIFIHSLWPLPVALFVVGWVLQFIGHYFEGKPPEFFSDYRFLFVGVRWWVAKMKGKA